MNSKYYTVDFIPTLKASEMHAAAYAANDIIFQCGAIEIPRGIGKLISTQVMYRGIDGVAQDADINLIFTDSYVVNSAGNAAANLRSQMIYNTETPSTTSNGQQPTIIGSVRVNNSDAVKLGTITHASSTCNIALSTDQNHSSLIEQALAVTVPSTTTSSVGTNKIWMYATCGAQVLDLRSGCTVDGTPGTGQKNLDIADVVSTAVFAPGDIIHDEDDRLMGTVSVLTDATNIGMVANLANAGVNDKKIYCLNPIEIRLVFEK